MLMTKVNIDGIAKEIAKQVKYYAKDVQEKVEVAKKETADQIKNDAQQDSPKRRPKYIKGWKVKKQKDSYIVHNTEYQLTHLLENGHMLRNGKRFNGIPHIRPAEEKGIKEFLKKIERAIEQ
jgi:hypothetical protein